MKKGSRHFRVSDEKNVMKNQCKGESEMKKKHRLMITLAMVCLLGLMVFNVEASTVDQYPWTQTLNNIFDSLKGPVAYTLAGIAIVVSGIAMAFTDLQGGARKLVQAALGISIAFGAVTILSTFFSFSGAMVH